MHEKKREERYEASKIRREERGARKRLLEETSDSESLSSEEEGTTFAEEMFAKGNTDSNLLPKTGSFDTLR